MIVHSCIHFQEECHLIALLFTDLSLSNLAHVVHITGCIARHMKESFHGIAVTVYLQWHRKRNAIQLIPTQ